MSQFALNLPPDAVETIHELAAERGLSDEDYVRNHLTSYLKELKALREIIRAGDRDFAEGRYIEITPDNAEAFEVEVWQEVLERMNTATS